MNKDVKESNKESNTSFLGSKNKSEKILFFVLSGITILFLIVAVFGKYMFAEGTILYELSTQSIGQFFDIVSFLQTKYPQMIQTVALLVFLWALSKVIYLLMLLITKKGSRAETLGKLFTSVLKYALMIVGIFLVLSIWGVETPTLLASAGILGLALSFGAQSLIEDMLAGLFIIFEKQFKVGDFIQVGDFRGRVTEIGIRTMKIESLVGDIKIINNSDVRQTINASSNLLYSICEISISYEEDLVKAENVIKDNLEEMKQNIKEIIEGPFYGGVDRLEHSGVVLRVTAKCHEEHKYMIRRALTRELKLLFDKHGITIPFNQIVVHMSNETKNHQ